MMIVALDFSSQNEALRLLPFLDRKKFALKIGSEMFTRFGPDFVRQLVNKGYKVFLDLKFHDIPNTVAKAIKAASELNIWMVNVHASGGMRMMIAAKKALEGLKEKPLLIAVTVLTSDSKEDFAHKNGEDLAYDAKRAGLDGVVCAPSDVPAIKARCGQSFLTITPGIRLSSSPKDDQVRVSTPLEAKAFGSDYLVIGRPITCSDDPQKVITELLPFVE